MLATGKVQHVIRENQCIIVNNMHPTFDITHGAVHCILHNSLGFYKVSSSCVPWQLTPEMKERHIHLPGIFVMIWNSRWLITEPPSDWIRTLAKYFQLHIQMISKWWCHSAHNNPKILHMGNSVKSDADIILASPRLTCEHCMSKKISHQCLILWPP